MGAGSLGRMLPTRPQLQSSEWDPDSLPAHLHPWPGFRHPCYRVTCEVIYRREWEGCAGPGAESSSIESIEGSSGHQMGFIHSLGLYPLFFAAAEGLGASVSWQCHGTKEPTHPKQP